MCGYSSPCNEKYLGQYVDVFPTWSSHQIEINTKWSPPSVGNSSCGSISIWENHKMDESQTCWISIWELHNGCKPQKSKQVFGICNWAGCNCHLGNAHIEVALIWKVLPLMFCEYICNFHAGINSIFVLWEQANPIMKPRPPFAGISAQGSLHWSLAEMDWCWFIDDNIKR